MNKAQINAFLICLSILDGWNNCKFTKFSRKISLIPSFFFFFYVFLNYYPRSISPIFAPANSTLNPKLYSPPMSNPTISIPRSQKRWPISTIFLLLLMSKKMHTLFVPPSCRHPFNSRFICGNSWKTIVPQSSPLSYHLRHRFHTTFVLPNIFNRLSINQFHNFPVFPTFHDFHEFPPFPAFHTIPSIPSIPSYSWFNS